MLKTLDPRLAWLDLHDPRTIGSVMQRPPIDFAVAAVGMPESVPASSIVGGADTESAIALDRQVANALGPGEPSSELVALFKRSPLTGCTSIMDMALTASRWNPLDPQQVGNHAGFMNYVTGLASTPFFTQPPIRETHPLQAGPGTNWSDFVGQIAKLMPGLSNANRKRVTDTVIHLAHNVFRPGGGDHVARQSMATLFTQQAISVNSGRIQIDLYFSQVVMSYKYDKSKNSASTTAQGMFNIERFGTGFQTSIWGQYAEAVAKKKITVVDEWLNKTTSPT